MLRGGGGGAAPSGASIIGRLVRRAAAPIRHSVAGVASPLRPLAAMLTQQREECFPRVDPMAELSFVFHLRRVAVAEGPECVAARLQPSAEEDELTCAKSERLVGCALRSPPVTWAHLGITHGGTGRGVRNPEREV